MIALALMHRPPSSLTHALVSRRRPQAERKRRLQGGGSVNCNDWNPTTVGTLAHHDHIILANLGLCARLDLT
jgi:hypothetical protein